MQVSHDSTHSLLNTAERDESVTVTIRIDPHVHSSASYDGEEPAELLLEQATEIGLDGIVVTDHDVIHESVRAAELAPLYGLVGIPGVEVSTANGHLLAIGITELPPRGAPMDTTIQWVRQRGGVAIIPHPFQRSRHGIRKRYLDNVRPDAIETYNSWAFSGLRNRRAQRYAIQHEYPGVAGSDAHKVGYVGRAYTKLELELRGRDAITADAVLAGIRGGATDIQGRRTPIPTSSKHYLNAGIRKSRFYAKRGLYTTGSVVQAGLVGAVRYAGSLTPFFH